MNLRWPVFVAAFVSALASAAMPAAAQFQQPQGEPPPCVKKFLELRADAEKKVAAIKAVEGKASPQVACKLFTSFYASESKMLKYATENGAWCGIPDQAVASMKQAHAQTSQIRARVCKVAAAGPPRPRGPSLSDALTGAVPDSSNIKSGHGTFDTLTGTPLGTR
jgi:hypothetical protein